MTLTLRQKIGIGLIVLAIVAGVVIQVETGQLIRPRTGADPDPSDEWPNWVTHYRALRNITYSWRYAGPVVACGAIGYVCLLPLRRKKKPL